MEANEQVHLASNPVRSNELSGCVRVAIAKIMHEIVFGVALSRMGRLKFIKPMPGLADEAWERVLLSASGTGFAAKHGRTLPDVSLVSAPARPTVQRVVKASAPIG